MESATSIPDCMARLLLPVDMECLWILTCTACHRLMDVLKGSGGSVRGLALHPEAPILASAGLDRWLRVYHTGTKKQLTKVYLKQHLTGVAWCPMSTATLPQAAPDKMDTLGKRRVKSTAKANISPNKRIAADKAM